MKHSLTILALSAVTLLISQCGFREQEAPEPSGGRPFALIAAPGETKTVNDGLSTRWEMDDPVSVFHAPAGTASYIRDGLFKIDIPATGHAVGTVQELSTGLYDWYLFYPGNPENGSTPGGSVTLEGTLTQSGYGSKAHLAGPGFPLGGKAGKVAFDAVPSVTLRPLASVIRVHVTNAQATPSRIKEVSFTAPEAVSGAFQVRWDGVFTASGNVSPAIRTQVEGGALLSTGETADVYLGLKPFQAAAGAVLTLSVVMEDGNGNQSYQERTLTLSSPASFQGGLIKTLNFSFDGEFDLPDLPQQNIGVYGYAGSDYLYAEGTDQISLRRNGNSYSFRLLRPASSAVYELSLLPLTLTPGETLTLQWSGAVSRVRQFSASVEAKVIKVEGGKAWLLSSDQTVFVIKTL